MLGLAIPYSAYPLLYTVKIALTLAAIAFVLPGYRHSAVCRDYWPCWSAPWAL